MPNAPGRGKPEQLSLALRRVTRSLHDVSEERFDTLSRLAPERIATHLAMMTRMLLAWHAAATGNRAANSVPRVLARAMAGHEAAVSAADGASPPLLPVPLARFTLMNRAEAIGSAYTICGAALGLRPALRSAAPSGPEEQQRMEGLACAGAAMQQRWRGMRRAIDLWGLEHPHMQADVLAGACTAFCVALTILDAMVEQNMMEASRHA